MKFPIWTPGDLCAWVQNNPTHERTELYYKLATHHEMEKVWAAIDRRTPKIMFERRGVFFAGNIYDLHKDIPRREYLSKTETRKVRNKVAETAKTLSDLLIKLGWDNIPVWAFVMPNIGEITPDDVLYDSVSDSWDTGELPVAPILEVTKRLAVLAKDDSFSPKILKSRCENEEVVYFIRRLTWRFMYLYRQPLREVVAITSNILFDREDIDAPRVAKMAPESEIPGQTLKIFSPFS